MLVDSSQLVTQYHFIEMNSHTWQKNVVSDIYMLLLFVSLIMHCSLACVFCYAFISVLAHMKDDNFYAQH